MPPMDNPTYLAHTLEAVQTHACERVKVCLVRASMFVVVVEAARVPGSRGRNRAGLGVALNAGFQAFPPVRVCALWGMCLLRRDAIVLTSPPAPGVQFEVKRVELQGSATLFCCWLVKDLLHSHQDSATRTRLLLASLPSSSHSMRELSGSSVGEVRLCTQLLPCTPLVVWEGVLPGLSLFLSASSGMGGGSV